MPTTIATLQAILSVDEGNSRQTLARFNAAMNESRRQSESAVASISQSFQSVGSALMRGGALISAGITAPLAAISEMGRDFETTLRRVAANTAMTDAQLNQMRETIIEMGRSTSAPMNDLAQGYMHVTNFGFQAADATKILDAAMKDAVATGAQTEAVANTLAGVLHEFGLSGQQASEVMNTLALAAARGNLTLEQFTNVSGRVFSTAANLGLGVQEAAAAMSALTRAGFPAAQASTQLVGALNHLVNPTREMRDEIARLSKATGIDLVRDFSQAGLQSKGLAAILDDVKRAVGGNTAEALKLFGGLRGGLGVMALIGNASKDYRDVLEETNQTMGGKLMPNTAAYNREAQSLGQQLGVLKNHLVILGDTINQAFSGSQVGFIKGITEAVDALTRGFQSLDPAVQKATLTIVGAFAVGGPIALAIGGIIAIIGGPLTLAIIGVTGALAVMAGEWVLRNQDIGRSTSDMTRGLQDAFRGVASGIGTVMDVLGVFANGLMLVVKSVALLIGSLYSLGLALTGQFTRAWETFTNVWSNGIESIKQSWTDMMADMNGRWAKTLSSMIDKGFAAARGFGAAGSAAGMAYMDKFQQAIAQRAAAKILAAGNVFRGGGANLTQGEKDAVAKGLGLDMADPAKELRKAIGDISNAASAGGGAAGRAFKDKFLEQINEWLAATHRSFTMSKEMLAGLTADARAKLGQLSASWRDFSDTFKRVVLELEGGNRRVSDALAGVIQRLRSAAGDFGGMILDTAPLLTSSLNTITRTTVADAHLMAGGFAIAEGAILGVSAAQTKMAHDSELAHKALVDSFNDLSRELPTSFNQIINGVLNASGRVGDGLLKLGVKIKGWAADIIGVINTLPGKFGDVANRILRTIDTWLQFANSILGILNRISSSIPATLGGLVESIIGIFKRTETVVVNSTNVWDYWGDGVIKNVEKAATGVQQGIGSMFRSLKGLAGALPSLLGGISAIFGGAGLIGRGGPISGAIGGATAAFGGSMILSTLLGLSPFAAATGPLAPFILGGGALIGAIAGLFGGKSKLQKAQEAAQIQQLKDQTKITQQQALQAVEATKQSLIETSAKARELIESLRFYTKLPEGALDDFFSDLNKFTKRLARAMEKWKDQFTADMKAAAETLAAGLQAISALPAIFVAVSSHLRLDDARIEGFFRNVEAFTNRLGEFMASIPRKIQKAIGKFGERTAGGFEILSPLIEAMTSLRDLRSVPAASFDNVEAALKEIVARLGRVSESVGKGLQKSIGFFAEQIAPAVELWKSTIEAIRGMVDMPVPTAADFDNLFISLERGLARSIALAARVAEETLPRAARVWEYMRSIYDSIKGGIEFLKGMVELTRPTEEQFDNLFTGLTSGLNRAIAFALRIAEETLPAAVAVWGKAQSIFDAIKSGVETVKEIAEAKWPDTTVWDGFLAAIERMVNALIASIGQFARGRDASAQMLSLARETRDNVIAAAAAMSSAASALGSGATGSFAAASPDVLTGRSLSQPPLAARAAAAAPQTIININMPVHGSLIHESQISDLLRRGLRGAQSRGVQINLD